MATPEEMRDQLRAFALSLPDAYEASPWGESVVKVRNKIFVFFGGDSEPNVGFGVKLPESNEEALAMPGIEPAGYGLGKSGWMNVTLPADKTADPDLYREWVMESYRAVAPKKLSAQLDAAASPPDPSV